VFELYGLEVKSINLCVQNNNKFDSECITYHIELTGSGLVYYKEP